MTAKEFIEKYIHLIDKSDLDYLIELAFLNLTKAEWFKFVDYMYQADIDIQESIEKTMSRGIHGALEDYMQDYPGDTFLEDNEKIKTYIHSQLNNNLGLSIETINRLIDKAIEELTQE